MSDKNNVTGMTKWHKGDRILATHLDQPRQVLEQQAKVAGGSQSIGAAVARVRMQMFQVIEVKKDYLRCFLSDSEGQSTEIFNIALPHLLQQTHYEEKVIAGDNRKNITYVYATNIERTATNDEGEEETQVILPSYEVNDIIIGMTGISGGTNVLDENGEEVIWMDMNTDGRFWAASSE